MSSCNSYWAHIWGKHESPGPAISYNGYLCENSFQISIRMQFADYMYSAIFSLPGSLHYHHHHHHHHHPNDHHHTSLSVYDNLSSKWSNDSHCLQETEATTAEQYARESIRVARTTRSSVGVQSITTIHGTGIFTYIWLKFRYKLVCQHLVYLWLKFIVKRNQYHGFGWNLWVSCR